MFDQEKYDMTICIMTLPPLKENLNPAEVSHKNKDLGKRLEPRRPEKPAGPVYEPA